MIRDDERGLALPTWHAAYLRHPPHHTIYATYHAKPAPHLLPFPSLANWARAPAAVGCFCLFLQSPEQVSLLDCHGLDELLLPMHRIEKLEMRSGNTQYIMAHTPVFHWWLVVSQQVEQSAHVTRGLLRLPACLENLKGSRSACVFSRACWVLRQTLWPWWTQGESSVKGFTTRDENVRTSCNRAWRVRLRISKTLTRPSLADSALAASR